jgi:hypothetical protein
MSVSYRTIPLRCVDPQRLALAEATIAWLALEESRRDCQEVAALAKSYGCYKCVGDRYRGQWVREAFRSEGITYEPSPLTASDLYLENIALLNSGRVELLDSASLLREFQNLERRASQTGKDRVTHPVGGHDDLANSVAGVAYLAIPRAPRGWVL